MLHPQARPCCLSLGHYLFLPRHILTMVRGVVRADVWHDGTAMVAGAGSPGLNAAAGRARPARAFRTRFGTPGLQLNSECWLKKAKTALRQVLWTAGGRSMGRARLRRRRGRLRAASHLASRRAFRPHASRQGPGAQHGRLRTGVLRSLGAAWALGAAGAATGLLPLGEAKRYAEVHEVDAELGVLALDELSECTPGARPRKVLIGTCTYWKSEHQRPVPGELGVACIRRVGAPEAAEYSAGRGRWGSTTSARVSFARKMPRRYARMKRN